ncbi:MAG: beta-lactamase family protein, partial [Bacteroidetes Order II. Incertae sedis bacterium]|nr:beta-lactamase family protein [Bacteroidetes Order II. bacterium]
VLITRAGKPILSRAHGWADLEHQVANTTQTKFRIGSVTKQFTAMAILILHERGKLRLTDPIASYIPNSPDAWSDISIHHLLTHTSGIMHSWKLPNWRDTMMEPATLTETIDRFRDQPLEFTPGESFAYSGVGYFILALIIEHVSGKPYGDFLHEAIFAPLGMRNTGADHYKPVLSHRATGYVWAEAELAHAPPIFMPILTGGGNLYSTVEDLTVWDQALGEKRLISDALYERMYTPVRNNYAYGWKIQERFGLKEISHGGWVLGSRALILRYPEERVCIVVLTNADHSRKHRGPMRPLSGRATEHPHSWTKEAHPWADLAAIVFGNPPIGR